MHIPSGLILVWSGSIGSIPAGFVLCDGNNGTPDLRDNFIVGAGTTYSVDETGGSLAHNHGFTSSPHTHDTVVGSDVGAGSTWDNTVSAETVTGTTDSASSLPPFYALAFVMKT